MPIWHVSLSFLCGVCWQDGSGRVDLESLKDGELDYGCDQAGLAELRQRTKEAVHNYEGALHDGMKQHYILGTSSFGRNHVQQYSTHAISPCAGQFAAYVNAVKEAFNLETVCKCRSSRDYTQKSLPTPGTSLHLLHAGLQQLMP